MTNAHGLPATREDYAKALQALMASDGPFNLVMYGDITKNSAGPEPTDGPDSRPVHFEVGLFVDRVTNAANGTYWACLSHVTVVVTPRPCNNR